MTCVQFVPKTHMFFSAGTDGTIKQWDGDTYDHIQTLKVSFLQGNHNDNANTWYKEVLALSLLRCNIQIISYKVLRYLYKEIC